MSDQSTGQFVWYDLMTTDPDGAMAFYKDVVGWGTTQWEGSGPEMTYNMWTVGENPMGGVMQMPEDVSGQGVPPHWIAYISTSDIEATCSRAQELGATIMSPPTDIPDTGTFAVVADPQGAVFALYTPADGQAAEDLPPRKCGSSSG